MLYKNATDRAWVREAACRNMNPDIFFPDQSESAELAKEVCRSCPVRRPCLEYALAYHERFGIWGGLSDRNRNRIKKARSAYVRNRDDMIAS